MSWVDQYRGYQPDLHNEKRRRFLSSGPSLATLLHFFARFSANSLSPTRIHPVSGSAVASRGSSFLGTSRAHRCLFPYPIRHPMSRHLIRR